MKSAGSRKVAGRYVKAYLSLLAMICFFAGISLMKGAGWKPLLIPLPLFVLLFAGITYQLIKEMRSIKRDNSTDQD